MKIIKSYYRVARVAIVVFAMVGISGVAAEPVPEESTTKSPNEDAQEETTTSIPVWKKWQKDIVHFDAMLQGLIETADIPEKEELKKRLESESGWVEVITDGYGGVVDFNAAKGTVQYEANNLIGSGGPYIDWEVELASDTKINYDKSTGLVPKIAQIANEGDGKSEGARFFISIAESDDGPFKAGDRIRLRASIDDFSRFKKRYNKATGLIAIYYLEKSPNPIFDLRLEKAKVTLLEAKSGEQRGSGQPANRAESK